MSARFVILASNSPRRRELLSQAGFEFVSDPADVDETPLTGERPAEYVERLALAKAAETASRRESGLVVGADTVVVLDGEMLGKPASEGDARRMLALLSGRAHQVLTGVAVVDAATGGSISGVDETEVRFVELSPQDIEEYVKTGEPMDKAGAYGIQGRASVFVEGITGSHSNVVGLPMSMLARMLKSLGAR